MSIFSDALIDGSIVCGISIPFIIINLLIIKAIYKKNISNLSLFFIFGAIISICFVFGITCFSDIHYETFNITNIFSKDNLNLKIFSSINQFFIMSLAGGMGSILNLYGNIAIFIPIGFFLCGTCFIGKKHKQIKVTTICFLISLFIELFQVSFNRLGDIDDIILNTFGGFVGCLLFVFFNNIFDINKKIIKYELPLFKKALIIGYTIILWIIFLILIYYVKSHLI